MKALTTRTVALAAASILAVGLAACASDPNSSAPASAGASGTSEREAKSDTSNAMLTGKVKAALAADVGLKTWDIDVDSFGTTVTLNGAVDSEATRKRAEEVARAVEGVATVKNNLTVKKGG